MLQTLNKTLKKTIIIATLVVMLTVQNIAAVSVYAEEVSPTPTETQSAPTPPSAPTAPTAPSAPSSPEPTTPPTPSTPSIVEPTAPPAPEAPSTLRTDEEQNAAVQQATATPSTSSNGTSSNGSVGDSAINTGNANTDATVTNTGNTNTSTTSTTTGGPGSTTVSNTGNGALTTNSSSTTTTNTTTTTQGNSASVITNLNADTTTGNNSTSYNVGDSSINTGDANTSGTVITAVNTNVAGVAVAEFNVIEDHVGDIILDFNQGCVSGCNGQSVTVNNAGNGTGSTNVASNSATNDANTFQSNDATVGSNLTLSANSGNNDANFNTGGDSNITTGDANVQASAVTFANNNIAGNVIYGVVNIFGDLIGDIIIPQDMLDQSCSTCGGSTTVANSGNGTDSTNVAANTTNNTTETVQFNDATIDNNVILDANTGDNDASFNTGGTSTLQSGDTNLTANILNVANTNISGGTFWLVIVNEAGKWIGKILGAPEGQNYAGSPLFEFAVGDNGEITASTPTTAVTNSGNGANSQNFATNEQSNTTSTTQENTAVIENNMNLSANTGGNNTNFNTGGNSNIVTGDANIIANLVNFVNNNIVGDGKLVVTVVNVFGSWLGDLVTPGQTQREKTTVVQQSQQQQNSHIGGVIEVSNQETNEHEQNNTGMPANNNLPTQKTESKVTYAAYTGNGITQSTTQPSHVDTLIAGASSKVLGTAATQEMVEATKQITINLAWLLVILPLGLIALKLLKKMRTRRTAAPHLNA